MGHVHRTYCRRHMAKCCPVSGFASLRTRSRPGVPVQSHPQLPRPDSTKPDVIAQYPATARSSTTPPTPTNPYPNRSNPLNPLYPRPPPAPRQSPSPHPTPPPAHPPGRYSGHSRWQLTPSPLPSDAHIRSSAHAPGTGVADGRPAPPQRKRKRLCRVVLHDELPWLDHSTFPLSPPQKGSLKTV